MSLKLLEVGRTHEISMSYVVNIRVIVVFGGKRAEENEMRIDQFSSVF